jgi:hypothetical protein
MLDEDKLAALTQERSSPAAEMLVMFRWKSCEQTPRTGMQGTEYYFRSAYGTQIAVRERRLGEGPINMSMTPCREFT